MAIKFTCDCGAKLTARDVRAGSKTQCPTCGRILRIPQPDTGAGPALPAIRFSCSCGKRVKARAEKAGKRVGCPRCGAVLQVPHVSQRPAQEDVPLPGQEPAPQPAGQPLGEPDAEDEDISDYDLMPPPEEQAPVPSDETFGFDDEFGLKEDSDEDLAGPQEPQATPASTHPSHADAGEPDYPDDDDQPKPRRRTTQALLLPGGGPGEALCATCGGAVPVDSVVCTHCGMNFHTGAMVAVSEELSATSREMSDEGIRTTELTKFFSATGPVQAAMAGVQQVIGGFVLYIPYAGLLAAAVHGFAIMKSFAKDDPTTGIVLAVVSGLFSLFMWAGFVGCVKDGVFQRFFGIERLLHHGATHMLRFGLTVLLSVPLWIGWWLGTALALGGAIGLPLSWWVKVPLALVTCVAAVAFALWLLFLPSLAVLEQTNPVTAVIRGTRFVCRQGHRIMGLAVTLLFLGGIGVGWLWLFYTGAKTMLWAVMPPVAFHTLNLLMTSIIVSGLWGDVLASLMMLYLSHQDDNERLLRIQSKLKGPHCRAWLVRVAMVLALTLPFLFAVWNAKVTGSTSAFGKAGFVSPLRRSLHLDDG